MSVVNYQNPGKIQEKVNLTLCYGHYITDITLWMSHHRHYIMVYGLGEINVTCKPILFKLILSHPSLQCFQLKANNNNYNNNCTLAVATQR